jgi:hypothetical protein
MGQWRALVSTVMKARVPLKPGNNFTILMTTSSQDEIWFVGLVNRLVLFHIIFKILILINFNSEY